MKKNFLLGLIIFNSLISVNLSAKVIQIKGSDTILNASQVIAEQYMNRSKARIAVTGGGSGVGISSLINGTTDIAMSSRDIKQSEIELAKNKNINIKEEIIGYDGITIITNLKNNLANITSEELGKIFRGDINNWKDVGGPDADIVVLSRDSSSGTHEFFKEHIVRNGNSKGKEEYGKNILYMPSNESIKQEISSNEKAIGYIGMGYMDKSVKNISVDNIQPSVENVFSKKYPIARAVYWYVSENASSEIKELINYATSSEGQKYVKEEGFVPIN
ncbi:MAG: phosphate ABC transporter substrate-binding protein [Fusobacteriaceae bacterium]